MEAALSPHPALSAAEPGAAAALEQQLVSSLKLQSGGSGVASPRGSSPRGGSPTGSSPPPQNLATVVARPASGGGGPPRPSSPGNGIGTSGASSSPRVNGLRRTSSMASSNGGTAQKPRHCFIIGVAGGTASGKTTVCDQIMQRLHDQCVVMLSQDSFYRDLTASELQDVKNHNFDHPDAFDRAGLMACLEQLKVGSAVNIPIYDYALHRRAETSQRVEPADVVIIEGILVLQMEEIRDMLNMKIYVDTDDDVRLARRIQRDVAHRGRDVAGVIEQYTRFVKPAFDQFVAPSRRFADIIIPWQRGDNMVAIDLITEHIRLKLRQHDLIRIYPSLEVIPSNFQTRGMHTLIRDAQTNTNDFVFYANRLNRLVVEAGLGHLPFREKTVTTPTGHPYVGVEFCRGLCGVSVIRSGEAMENALRECCQGIKIGKILVHRHGAHEEVAVYDKLPSDIATRWVLLLDPVLGTGNTACRVIQVLLDRGVQQNKVLFLSIYAAPEGIHKVCRTFPRVKVITSEIDTGLDENCCLTPGVGEFGNRYFCD